MTLAQTLIPFPVAIPLAAGGLMLAVAHFLPRRIPDIAAILIALLVSAISAYLAFASRDGALVYWFGGWAPNGPLTLGVGFGVDPVSASVASFVALLFAAAFIYAWGYFDEVHAVFHLMMLLFLAGMQGFCLTRDIFNMFVWFEVMSVAAFALTGYRLEAESLAGAINFTVTNSLASFAMLAAVGLLYARGGVLDFEALGRVVANNKTGDPVLAGAFCLLALALLTKSAVVPLHFWLSDAHAVAPTPVSVVFSGAMVPLGLFGFAKITHQIFARSEDALYLLRDALMYVGALTAVMGGLMAWSQRHLKRMLAFSTISHMGIMLTGLAAPSPWGLSGLVCYLVGHGLVKGALFMLIGILPAIKASVDELELRGLGADIWPAGVATAVAALLLAGAPVGVLSAGDHLIDAAVKPAGLGVPIAADLIGAGLTGAALLRSCGRIYLGWGGDGGEEAEAPTAKEQELADRPFWLLMAPCVVLLIAAAAVPSLWAENIAMRYAALLSKTQGEVQGPPEGATWSWISLAIALLVSGLALVGPKAPKAFDAGVRFVYRPLNVWHSGLVTDYVVWMMVGLSLFCFALYLR